MSFVNLHFHTSYSDGLGNMQSIVKAVVDHGQTACAITDHGTIAGWIEFYQECRKQGVKPIFGVELYVEYEVSGNKHTGHMTMLAKNKMGFDNIQSLVTAGHKLNRPSRAVTFEEIIAHRAGCILLSGCMSSPLIAMRSYDEFLPTVDLLKGAFGPNFYLEVMPHVHMPDYVNAMVELMQELDMSEAKLMATIDVHYADAILKGTHMFVHSMRKHYTYDNTGLYNRVHQEMEIDMRDTYGHYLSFFAIESAVHRSGEVASHIEDIVLDAEPQLPKGDTKELIHKFVTEVDNITLYADKNVYAKRAIDEWEVVKKLGYQDYFYIAYEIINEAKRRGIEVGRGRGSAAGCLILYLLGVTDIDPIRYNLMFERFLNENRGDWPDIDMDFEHERRDELIEYAANRWGASHVSTRIKYSHKSLVRDIARKLEYPRAKTDKAAMDESSPEFQELMSLNPIAPTVYEVAMGQIKHEGKHAGGFVISATQPPLERLRDGTLAVPWGAGLNDNLTPVGLIKFDLLALKSLTALRHMREISGAVPASFGEDEDTLDLFRKGRTRGVFQMSNDNAINIITSIEPETGADIGVGLSLIRPGPINSGMADQYQYLKNNPRLLHPKIDPILEETRGVFVYQEQLMQVFQIVTGYDAKEADHLRKIVGKKKVTDPKWATYKDAFITGCWNSLGMSKTEGAELWGEIETFGDYGFNKSHAIAYAHISWDTAWYKVWYQSAFYTAMLEQDQENTMSFMHEAVMNEMIIKPPNVNMSSLRYATDGLNIFMPFTAINRVGPVASEVIISARSTAPFSSMQDFLARVDKRKVHVGVRFSLFASGAFEGISGSAIADLQLDPAKVVELQTMTNYEAQRQHLHLIVPHKEIMDELLKINLTKPANVDVGMIDQLRQGENDRGHYTLITLQPSGKRYFFGEKFNFVPGELLKLTRQGRETRWTKLM